MAYFDGPAGSQVPTQVVEAISNYYLNHNANTYGNFPTSRETKLIMEESLQAACDWFGGSGFKRVLFWREYDHHDACLLASHFNALGVAETGSWSRS